MRTDGITKPSFGGELAPQRLDLLGEPVVPSAALTSGSERVADLDLEVVDLEDVGDRLVLRRVAGARGRRRGARGGGAWRAFMSRSTLRASHAAPPASARNGSIGMPGRSAIAPITAADMPSAFG